MCVSVADLKIAEAAMQREQERQRERIEQNRKEEARPRSTSGLHTPASDDDVIPVPKENDEYGCGKYRR